MSSEKVYYNRKVSAVPAKSIAVCHAKRPVRDIVGIHMTNEADLEGECQIFFGFNSREELQDFRDRAKQLMDEVWPEGEQEAGILGSFRKAMGK
jgi:hypothetical protein